MLVQSRPDVFKAIIEWDVLYNMNQTESWEYFYTVINQIIEDCVPNNYIINLNQHGWTDIVLSLHVKRKRHGSVIPILEAGMITINTVL